MKNYILHILITLFAFVGHVNAQTSYSMVVEKNDGGKVTIPTADIKQISFEENKNTDYTSLFQGPKRIFGNNQLKAMGREGYDRYEFTYNDKGYVTKIHRVKYNDNHTEDYIFEYNSDAIMLNIWEDGFLVEIVPISVGMNGLASGFSYDKDDISNDKEDISFVYNDKDQLIDIIYQESKGTGIQKLIWQNGNIIREEENYDDYPTYISYTTPSSDAIENIAGVMEYDDGMHIDLDDYALLYYAGLLGKGTKHLPMAWTHEGKSYTKKGKNTWTLDGTGRAVKLVNEQENSDSSLKIKTFYWEW